MDLEQTLDVGARICLALGASAAIGLERESHGRAAGLRTTILVGVASAVAMVLSEVPYAISDPQAWRPDPMRLAAGVLTGMGFLGAGTIIKDGNVVRGVTTAATLWLVAILGLAFGSGHWEIGVFGWLAAMLTLFVLPKAEQWIKNDWYSAVTLVIEMDGVPLQEVRARIGALGLSIKRIELDYDLANRTRTIMCEVKYKREDLISLSERAMTALVTLPGVKDVKWR